MVREGDLHCPRIGLRGSMGRVFASNFERVLLMGGYWPFLLSMLTINVSASIVGVGGNLCFLLTIVDLLSTSALNHHPLAVFAL